ncbi:MAG: AAC(3) family N-acetyltransferase [Armatimonadetes bacterium]|nr:AAC(3) family N-acetyltransferase [Armatimonadota bacterium]
MTFLTQSDIVAGLKTLGVQPGDRILVHSSLVALGRVEGGADAVIDALLEAVGPQGMVVMPTFACSAPFDRRTSSTGLGLLPERFWRRPGAVRSLHPTHSVAAVGREAEEIIRDHEKAPTAYAEGTPYYNLAMNGGKVLLLGVDQDRNTTLHTAEALAGSPYLSDIEATYIDERGQSVTIPVAAMAGPHRDFIGLDQLFRKAGVMMTGRIGKAVCRLLDGKGMLETALEALRLDPAAVLCGNPACADCVLQRGKIKAARLAGETFVLAAAAGDISDNWDDIEYALQGEGVRHVELTRKEYDQYRDALKKSDIKVAAVRARVGDEDALIRAASLEVPLVLPAASLEEIEAARAWNARKQAAVYIENSGPSSAFYRELYAADPGTPLLAFNPARFASAGEKPFLGIFNNGPLRKKTAHFYLDDATFDGDPALPGCGNGEVKEILSMLRCRSYEGVITLRSHVPGVAGFRQTAGAFWRLLEMI